MKKTKTMYWIFTALFAFGMLGSSIPDILIAPAAIEGFKKIGMPVYLIPFLGVAKALGVIAILIPGLSRLKEWAYAGLMFDLAGATYSVLSIGMPLLACIPMFVLILIGAFSYLYYHKMEKARALRKQHLTIKSLNPFQNAQIKTADAGIA